MSSFVKKNADLQKNEEKLKMFMELQQNLLTKLLEGHKAIETALKAFATMSQFVTFLFAYLYGIDIRYRRKGRRLYPIIKTYKRRQIIRQNQ